MLMKGVMRKQCVAQTRLHVRMQHDVIDLGNSQAEYT